MAAEVQESQRRELALEVQRRELALEVPAEQRQVVVEVPAGQLLVAAQVPGLQRRLQQIQSIYRTHRANQEFSSSRSMLMLPVPGIRFRRMRQ